MEMKQTSLRDSTSFAEDARWQLVLRVVKSSGFSRSARLPSLLRYVTQRMLEGRIDEISEQQIGVHVFGRPSDYNPAENNIVRAHARLLRQKLEEFYRVEGSNESLLLTIPKGGYVPVFHSRPPLREVVELKSGTEDVALLDTPLVEPVPRSRQSPRLGVLLLVFAAVLGAVYWRGTAQSSRQTNATAAPRGSGASHVLWSRIFEQNRPTLMVVADSGLVMYQNLARRPISLAEYLSRRYLTTPVALANRPEAQVLNGLAARRYTSFADLNLVSRLTSLPEILRDRFRVCFARDLGMNDFKQNNIILSGAAEANPWLELFANRLTFDIQEDHTLKVFRVSNLQKAAGEEAVYNYNPQDPLQWAYSVVAFLPGKSGNGNVLVIEGTTTAGTEAAADFVLDEKALEPILKRAQKSDNSLHGFEVLLRTRNMAGSAPEAQLVTSHFQ